MKLLFKINISPNANRGQNFKSQNKNKMIKTRGLISLDPFC